MKKAIIITLTCIILVLTLTACGNKTALSADEFSEKAEENDLQIVDVSADYASYDFIESSTAAVYQKGDDRWQIELAITTDDDKAEYLFDTNKAFCEEKDGNTSTVSMNNYDTFENTADDAYMYICRVDDTVLYASVDIEFKEDVQDFVKKLGY